MDDRYYRLSKKEFLRFFAGGFGISVLVAWLFFRSPIGMAAAILLIPMRIRSGKRQKLLEKKQALLLQFRDAMRSVSLSLLSGYSVENAWLESERETEELYGAAACMTMELGRMNAAVRLNEPLEQVFYQFAFESGCEEIISFAEVFCFAKRSGGDFAKIIQKTVVRISEKIEVEREIQTVIAGKKMEQKVMSFVPFFMILYLNLTSREFMTPLYGNTLGAAVMSIALFLYLCAVMLAEKLSDIRV